MKYPELIQTNFDIMDICSKVDLPLSGVFMRDEFPNNFRDGENYILNLDSKNNDGTHFTACCFNNRKCFYNDSYGAPPPIEFLRTLKRKGYKCYYNDKQTQALESSSCAYWSIAFLLWMNKIFKNEDDDDLDHFQKFIDMFHPENQNYNEKVLKKFLKPF